MDADETKRQKARQLRYKKPIVKNLKRQLKIGNIMTKKEIYAPNVIRSKKLKE